MARSQFSSRAKKNFSQMRAFTLLLLGMVAAALLINFHYAKRRAGYRFPDAYVIPARIEPRTWRYIVIHHSATDNGNAAVFDRYHRQKRNWDSLAYHFVIGNGNGSGNGEIEVGSRWLNQVAGAHSGDSDLNQVAIGICLVGNFMESYPTRNQMNSLVTLIRRIQKDYGIPGGNVLLHHQINAGHTVCPGKNFPFEELMARLEANPIVPLSSREANASSF